jgi:hypothetical protein
VRAYLSILSSLPLFALGFACGGCTIEALDPDYAQVTLKAAIESVDVAAARRALDARGMDEGHRKGLMPLYTDTALRYGHERPETLPSKPDAETLEELLYGMEKYALYTGPKLLYGKYANVPKRALEIQERAFYYELALLGCIQPQDAHPDDWIVRAALGELAYQFGYAECVASTIINDPALTPETAERCLSESRRGALQTKIDLVRRLLERVSARHADQADECANLEKRYAAMEPFIAKLPTAGLAAAAAGRLRQDLDDLCQADPTDAPRTILSIRPLTDDLAALRSLQTLTAQTIQKKTLALDDLPAAIRALYIIAPSGETELMNRPAKESSPPSLRSTTYKLMNYERQLHAIHSGLFKSMSMDNLNLAPLTDLLEGGLATAPKL